jgi:multiple sugar transport system permease protein
MKNRDFIFFVGPSLVAMFVCIAIPLIFVLEQSFFVNKKVYKEVEVESCVAGFTGQICSVEMQTKPQLNEKGEIITQKEFVGLESYMRLINFDAVKKAFWQQNFLELENVKFFRALRFTVTFCLITLQFVIILGLVIALTVNNLLSSLKGPIIFVSLLPFIITPIIGALSIRWLFVGDGIITAFLEWLTNSNISMFSNSWTLELMMILYRIWHVCPFAFIVFYAGLQTINKEMLESAIVDGANRYHRLRFIIIPHLMPLIVFVSLIHLMDSYRVFEEIVAFSSDAYVISLQWLTFDFLRLDDTGNRYISSASASSILTMIGISILLYPLIKKTWNDYREGKL